MGGFSQLKPMDAKVSGIVGKLRSDIESKAGRSFRYFQPEGYEQQVVAGTKYKVQIKTD